MVLTRSYTVFNLAAKRMIEAIWFHQHWLGKLLYPLLRPLSAVFGMIARHRRAQYQSGKKTSYRAKIPVVVVGNITVGGNGKTPIVIYLVEALQAMGFKPGVVSRGYGGEAAYPLILTEDTLAAESGDEPLLIYRRTSAPVVVDPNRAQAVQCLEAMDVDIVITDDGLQHYQLARDIEIVVIDGHRRFGNKHYLPLGPLREQVNRLNEVDFCMTNGGIAHHNEMGFGLEPDLAINLMTREKAKVSDLNRLVAIAGIGHPPRFFDTLNTLGANLVKTQGFSDHQAFDQSEVENLAQIGDNLIMTEKDAVKLDGCAQSNWWYLPVSASLASTDHQILLTKITEVINRYGSSST